MVLSQGGAGLLVSSVRTALEVHRADDWVCMRSDIHNAFNEAYRAETVKVFSETPSLQHMVAFTGVTLAPVIGLECGGKLWGTSGEGGVQGDPITGDEFSVTLKPSLVKLDLHAREGGSFAIAGADNVLHPCLRARGPYFSFSITGRLPGLPLSGQYGQGSTIGLVSATLPTLYLQLGSWIGSCGGSWKVAVAPRSLRLPLRTPAALTVCCQWT